MKIVVLVKIVPKQIEFDRLEKRIVRSKEAIINPNDLIALGNAIRLKRKLGAEIFTLTMAPNSYSSLLYSLYDYGVDRPILLSDKAFANSDVYATSNVFVGFLKMFVPDFSFIFTGAFSSDGLTGQLAGEIAEGLGVPFLSNVLKIEKSGNDFRCLREKESVIEEFSVKGRAVISFSINSDLVALPSLYEVYRNDKRELEIYTNSTINLPEDKIGTKGSKTIVKDIFEIAQEKALDLITEEGHSVITKILEEMKE